MVDGKSASGTRTRDDLATLRAKHADYCSARVADAILSLSADEVFLLAREAARARGEALGESAGYPELVRLATERLARRLPLPSLEEFLVAYDEDPEPFDREMMGLWQEDR
jgi:hypothetical protein